MRTTSKIGVVLALWSSDFSLITGQAMVTARAAALLRRKGSKEFTYRGAGLSMLWTWLRSSAGLWWTTFFGRVDTLYMVCSRSNFGFLRDLPAYLIRWLGVRVVVHVHGSDIVDLIQRRGIGWLAHKLLSKCELILPSHHLVGPLQRLGISQLHVCENFAVDPQPGTPRGGWSSPVATDRRALSVLWNSNIMASKGFFMVADAVAAMHNDGQPVTLVALGSAMADNLMSIEEVQQKLEALEQAPWFEYRGSVDRIASVRALGDSDVVCLPSTYSSECQPLAVIEAMCAGRRLLVARTPALLATVGEYPCETVSVIDAKSVREALGQLAAHPPTASILDAASAKARIRFSPTRFDSELSLILGFPPTGESQVQPAQGGARKTPRNE